MYKYLSNYVGIYTYVYLHVCMRMYVYVCIYVCMHACTFIIPKSVSVAVYDMYAYILHSYRRCR